MGIYKPSLDSEKYTDLEHRNQSRIPYIKKRDIRADDLFLIDSYSGLIPRQIARGRNLSLKVVNQALGWCRENIDLVSIVVNEERTKAGLKPTIIR